MRFNYLIGLIIGTLICSLCIDAKPFGKKFGGVGPMRIPHKPHRPHRHRIRYSCSSTFIISITSRCSQNSFGQITEMVLNKDVQVEEGFFASFVALEKLTISGKQHYITQNDLVELSNLKTLKEVYFESEKFTSSQYNMNVFEQSNLSTLQIGQTNYYDLIAQKQEIQYSCSSAFIISICSQCVENSFGQITELVIKENVELEEGFFSALTALEKVTISGYQQSITQSTLVELTTIKTLKEVYFESEAFASSQYNMSIFEKCSNLSIVKIGQTTYFDRTISSTQVSTSQQNTEVIKYCCSNSYIMSITSHCVENSLGQIKEMIIKRDSHIKHGLFTALKALERVTISGSQHYITQSEIVELSTVKTLKEVYFESKAFTSSVYNMEVFKSCSKLSTLQISGVEYYDSLFY